MRTTAILAYLKDRNLADHNTIIDDIINKNGEWSIKTRNSLFTLDMMDFFHWLWEAKTSSSFSKPKNIIRTWNGTLLDVNKIASISPINRTMNSKGDISLSVDIEYDGTSQLLTLISINKSDLKDKNWGEFDAAKNSLKLLSIENKLVEEKELPLGQWIAYKIAEEQINKLADIWSDGKEIKELT